MINLSQVTKSYDGALVVDNVTIDLEPGGVTAIIGPNGAGKSSLLSMMARLLPMSAGIINVDGLDVQTTKSDIIAKKLAVLRQDNHVASRISVNELVEFGRYPHSKGRLDATDRFKVDQAIEMLELEDLRHRYLDQLSGGQRQRAFVAMVIAQDTPYLLLDEPLNNLDMKHAVSLMKLIRSASAEMGKTVLVVLHDINFASCYADKILIMRQGKLAHYGTPAQVITPQIMRNIYEIEVGVHTIAGQLISVFYE